MKHWWKPFAGKRHTEETKIKMKKNNARYWLGKVHTEKQKLKFVKTAFNQDRLLTKEERVKRKRLSTKKHYMEKPELYRNNQRKFRKNNPNWNKEYYRRKCSDPIYRQTINEQLKNLRVIKRKQVLIYYSNGVIQCKCCGELEEAFLTIDHIEGRRKWNHPKNFSGYKIYYWLIKQNFPIGFQVLCYNCNLTKGRLGYCPHKKHKPLNLLINN